MADAAVRVDIVVGQNTVVPAVQQTERALGGASRSAGVASAGFESLSRKGLKSVEIGFRQLAFQAAGVPGPMGKIAEGALLLGGGGGVLLGVAVAAGSIAVAWNKLAGTSKEAQAAIDRMNAALHRTSQAIRDIEEADAAASKKSGFASALLGAAAWVPGLESLATSLLKTATGIRAVASAYAALSAHGAADDFLIGLWGRLPDPIKEAEKASADAERIRRRQAEIANARDMSLPAQWDRNQAFTQQSVQINLLAQAYAQLNATASQTPAIMDGIAAAMDGIEQGLVDANAGFIQSLELSRQLMEDMQNIFLQGFMDLATGLAEALGSGGSFGDVLLRALGGLFQQMGQALIAYGIAMLKLLPALLNPFTSGAAAIAAGAALVAIGAALTKIATKSGPSGHAASGGVSAGGYARDQQQVAAMGTVTVKMGDGFIRASDPAFQEFLAEVIKQGKGRNVVFA